MQFLKKHIISTHFLTVISGIFLVYFCAVLPAAGIEIQTNPNEKLKEIVKEELRNHEIKQMKLELDAWLEEHTRYPNLPSSVVAVVQDNDFAYKKAIRSSFNRRYSTASFTKTFTALAVLQLAERGVIKLDDPVSKYMDIDLENEKIKSGSITIRHLLTHTSGIPTHGAAQSLHIPIHIPKQKYPAGFRFYYSNSGYNLLGMLVEKVSGLSLSDYITCNFLIPLEMHNSIAPANIRGCGGLQCTVDDLGNYIQMLLHEGKYKGRTIISKAIFKEIYRESVGIPPAKKKEYRGISWRVWTIDDRPYSLNHAALSSGSGGWMQIFPSLGVGFVFLSDPPTYNTPGFFRYYRALKGRLMKLSGLLSDKDENPAKFSPSIPKGHELNRFVGLYRDPNTGRVIDIASHDNRFLTAHKSHSGSSYRLIPTAYHSFVYIYPGQREKGLAFDFIWKDNHFIGLAVFEGYYTKVIE